MSYEKVNDCREGLIPSVFSLAYRAYLGLNHPFADNMCLALAAPYMGKFGLRGRSVLHVGSGFGLELMSSLFAGAESVIGLEKSKEKAEIGRSLGMVVEDEDWVRGLLNIGWFLDIFVSCSDILYTNMVDVLNDAVDSVSQEVLQFCRLYGIESPDAYNRYVCTRACDVLREDVLDVLEDKQRDVLVGNIVLPCLARRCSSLKVALDNVAPALRSGGVAVFSVPYHCVEQDNKRDDDLDRQNCVYDTGCYRVFRKHLLRLLPEQAIDQSVDFRKTQQGLVRECEVSAGSDLLEHVMTHRYYFSSSGVDFTVVLLGMGMFEAVQRTGKPASCLIEYVLRAVDLAINEIGWEEALRERFSTYVYFFVFRKKQAFVRYGVYD